MATNEITLKEFSELMNRVPVTDSNSRYAFAYLYPEVFVEWVKQEKAVKTADRG